MIRFALLFLFLSTSAYTVPKPSVLFIAVDDMNDWTSTLGGYSGKVHTPNLERLARMGMTFSNAHTASPVCCPSRTALMLGLRPSTTGIYNNGQWWLPHLPGAVSLPMHFKRHGYETMGAGKIYHHTAGFNPSVQWDDFQRLVFQDDPWFRGHKLNYPWSTPEKYPKGYPFSGLKGTPHEGDWGVIPGLAEAEYDDSKSVDYAVRALGKNYANPFFLPAGSSGPTFPGTHRKNTSIFIPSRKSKCPKCSKAICRTSLPKASSFPQPAGTSF